MPSACCVAVALTCCLMFARADILEDWIYPLEADCFLLELLKNNGRIFPTTNPLFPSPWNTWQIGWKARAETRRS